MLTSLDKLQYLVICYGGKEETRKKLGTTSFILNNMLAVNNPRPVRGEMIKRIDTAFAYEVRETIRQDISNHQIIVKEYD